MQRNYVLAFHRLLSYEVNFMFSLVLFVVFFCMSQLPNQSNIFSILIIFSSTALFLFSFFHSASPESEMTDEKIMKIPILLI